MSNPITPVFRAAGTADIDAVVALVESAYRGESGQRGWTTESHLLDGRRTDTADVAEVIARPHSRILLAEYDGQLLASCHVEWLDDSAYFGMFAVDPLQQGGGLGKVVLAEAERIARDEWHCRTIHMTVIVQRDELIAAQASTSRFLMVTSALVYLVAMICASKCWSRIWRVRLYERQLE